MTGRQGITGPLILITFGILLILNNLKQLPDGFFGSLWHFWPVVLILLGLDVLLSHNESMIGYLIQILFGIAVICGILTLAWSGIPASQSNIQMTPIDNQGADLRNTHLEGTNRFFVDLSHANMSGAYLNSANIFFADLSNTDMEGAQLNGANIFFADITDANIRNADVSGANIFFADLSGADLEGTNIEDANLIFTVGVGR
ncbi:MAG: pentapeptide repeat-containing protein [Methanosarcinaceae archaeon]|nr:pentapeptide repeat-containing protein [Methanosarcinaceae archaeon]